MELSAIVILAVVTFVNSQSTMCRTPRGGAGSCDELQQCVPLRNLSEKRPKTAEDIKHLRQSACGFSSVGKPKVCCPTQPAVQRAGTLEQPNVLPSPVVLSVDECPSTVGPPSPDCCGLESNGDLHRILGGMPTKLEEYPWLALMEYERELVYPDKVVKSVQTLCGGALISSRYVLTAAHCLKSSWGPLTNVRLGEYNTTSAPKDCVIVDGVEDCSFVLIVPVDKAIMHPQYNPDDHDRKNDIGLLKLKFAAPYTVFIRPICLPTKDVTVNAPPNRSFIVAGWGSDGTAFSPVKLAVQLPYVSMQQCQPHYEPAKPRISLSSKQICAGGVIGKDTCGGDSGGPLMYVNGQVFEAAGIVSFGPTQCGRRGIPGIYTHVYEYVDWITSEMKP